MTKKSEVLIGPLRSKRDSRNLEKTPKKPETETVKPKTNADSVSHTRSVERKSRLKHGSLKEIHDFIDEYSE